VIRCFSEKPPTTGARSVDAPLLRHSRPADGPLTAAADGAPGHHFGRVALLASSRGEELGDALNGGGAAAQSTDRKALFCHRCPEQVKPKVAVYSQWSNDHRNDNIMFARIFMLNHNVDLQIEHAGALPSLYDEEKQQFGKVESVADLCDMLKDLQERGEFPPKGGALPALFIPFGKQLRGDSGETLGWHIKDIGAKCQDFAKINATSLALVDSAPESKCSKALLHEIGHAVGNGDLADAPAIMGPCDPATDQKPPIGCDPDRTENTMSAKEVKKFCSAPF
jgi:hypothetical protein